MCMLYSSRNERARCCTWEGLTHKQSRVTEAVAEYYLLKTFS